MARNRRTRRRPVPVRRPVSWLRWLLGLGMGCLFGLFIFVFFNPFLWRLDLRTELEQNKVSSTIFDRHGEPLVTLYNTARLWVALHEMPKELGEAFVATEDARFYLHKGIDLRGILRAVYQDIKARQKAQGGSTITQQLVKNSFLSHEKSFLRKLWEMAYAIRIEEQYSKDEILEAYLNSIYLGHGAWGVAAASEVYFGKKVQDLTVPEAAMLAALARSPEYYSPFRHPQALRKRRDLVLRLMAERGYLAESDQQRLALEPLHHLNSPGGTVVGGYFADYITRELAKETGLSERFIRTAGLRIYTTIDREMQAAAEAALATLPVAKPDQWGVTQPQGAIVALDPTSGEILAMVGGRHYSAAQVNRAVDLSRQPGSAIKPFLFAAAIEAGYQPETILVDRPIEIQVNGTPWRPQNYDNQFRGPLTLQTALEESVNTIAVQLLERVGTANVLSLAKRMGLESLVESGPRNDNALAPLALGGLTQGVSLLELTGAYTAFAHLGIRSIPYGILRVVDRGGNLIYQGTARQNQVISDQTAATMTGMMEGVVTRGTGIRANFGVQAAGKTGTSNANTNGWFVGYTADVLAGVWIGNDRADLPLEVQGVTLGSGTAAAIWGNFLGRVSATHVALPPYSAAQ